jgi:hypothetical protein
MLTLWLMILEQERVRPSTGYPLFRLDVCIDRLGIAFSGLLISWDIHIEVNVNIFVWMCRYLVP